MPVKRSNRLPQNRRELEAEGRELVAEASSAVDDFRDQVRQYVSRNPESAVLWCLGMGFVLGWKLKIW